jgi:hypothetical protein
MFFFFLFSQTNSTYEDYSFLRYIALELGAARTSETSIFFESTRLYIPQGCNLLTRHSEILKSQSQLTSLPHSINLEQAIGLFRMDLK